MTIRQFLIRLGSRYLGRTAAFLLASGALVAITFRSFVLRFVCGVVMSVVTLAAIWSLFQIPCPRCRKSLGLVGFKVANSSGRSANSPAHCPQCAVSLDEPMPAGRDDLGR
jgi:hypothetical protein